MNPLKLLPKQKLLLPGILLLIGILLMTVPTLVEKGDTDDALMSSYSPDMAHIIKQMVVSLSGDSSPQIYLTTESATADTILADDGAENLTGGTSVAGVAVFCNGGADASFQLKLCKMLKRTFSISAAHIYIDEKQMQKGEGKDAVVGETVFSGE